MWHPFIQLLFYGLEPRCPTQPSDAFPGCVSQNETIKKRDRCEPCGMIHTHLKVFENRSIFYVRSEVRGKVKVKLWEGEKKKEIPKQVIFPIRWNGVLSSWRQMEGWALVPSWDATVPLTRSEIKSWLTAVVRQGWAVRWSELKKKKSTETDH